MRLKNFFIPIILLVAIISTLVIYFYYTSPTKVIGKLGDEIYLCNSDEDCGTAGLCGEIAINKKYVELWNSAHQPPKDIMYDCGWVFDPCVISVAICEDGKCKSVVIKNLDIDRIPEKERHTKELCINRTSE